MRVFQNKEDVYKFAGVDFIFAYDFCLLDAAEEFVNVLNIVSKHANTNWFRIVFSGTRVELTVLTQLIKDKDRAIGAFSIVKTNCLKRLDELKIKRNEINNDPYFFMPSRQKIQERILDTLEFIYFIDEIIKFLEKTEYDNKIKNLDDTIIELKSLLP